MARVMKSSKLFATSCWCCPRAPESRSQALRAPHHLTISGSRQERRQRQQRQAGDPRGLADAGPRPRAGRRAPLSPAGHAFGGRPPSLRAGFGSDAPPDFRLGCVEGGGTLECNPCSGSGANPAASQGRGPCSKSVLLKGFVGLTYEFRRSQSLWLCPNVRWSASCAKINWSHDSNTAGL